MDILLRQKNQKYKKDFICFIYGLFIKRLNKQINNILSTIYKSVYK